jgi:protein-serine/threonine kinase
MNDSGAAQDQPDITQDVSSLKEESRLPALVDDSNQPASATAPNNTIPSGLHAGLAAAKTASIPFQTNTIAPSPPATSGSPFASSSLGTHDGELASKSAQQGSSSALRISTDLSAALAAANYSTPHRHGASNDSSHYSSRGGITIHRKGSAGNLQPISRTPSLKTALSQSLQSLGGTSSAASSLMPSPIISAMGDMTPLPSPLMSADSPGPWKKLLASTPPKSRDRLGSIGERPGFVANDMADAVQSSSPPSKRKGYVAMDGHDGISIPSPSRDASRHTRNRSVSEYKPDPSAIPKRQITVSGSHAKPEGIPMKEHHMRRELNLAESRGLTPTITQPPTPPPSESSKDSSESARPKESAMELFEARGRYDNKRRRWRALKTLGQGTFSQVVLATSQIEPAVGDNSEGSDRGSRPDRKTLVAVKICEHGPRGGASEERVEMSLKRELEILLDIHHPSLIDLKAFSIEPTRAILVLTYSPGGDLFDVATAHRKVLVPSLLQRIFAELVGAVRYLHEKRIVHRDIKLESWSIPCS